jgi:hypothetical protein
MNYPNVPKMQNFSKKNHLEVGAIAITNTLLVLSMQRNSITLWSPKG